MVILLLLVLLFPLGVYLLVLAGINRREKPLMVSGVWDAVGLSAAMSGVLLWVGPALLGLFYERGLLAGAEMPQRRFNEIWALYPWIWVAYYVLILTGQALMILGRRNKTVVYNVSAEALEQLLIETLHEKGHRLGKSDGIIVFDTKPEAADASNAIQAVPTPRATFTSGVELESFLPMRHATLHWHAVPTPLRSEVEAALDRRLMDAATPDNPSTFWLQGLSGFCFGLVFLGALCLILLTLFPPRW